jgi:hypothetical protein
MQNHPNSDIDFYLMILESRKEILRPHVMVLYRGGYPEAMLIGRLEQERVEFRIGYRTVVRTHARVLTIVYGGRLGNESKANDEAFVSELTSSLKRGEADMAFLSYLRADSALYDVATRTPSFLCRDHFPVVNPHWTMSLAGSVPDVYRKLSHGARWQLRKLLKDFKGNVKVRCFRDPETMEHMIEAAEQIATNTYQRGLGVGFIDNNETRRRISFVAKRDWLRSYVLYVDGNPCAFSIGTVYGKRFHLNYLGYDPNYRKYSPGTFVLIRAIEDLHANGIREIDFGFGDAFYKKLFGDQTWQEASVSIFAPTLKGVQVKLLNMLTATTARAASKLLSRSRILHKVKRIWRDHLIPK